MGIITIQGGTPLRGETVIQGAKNSALPILAASLLSGDVCRIEGCPHLSDVDSAADILRYLGCTVVWEDDDLLVDSRTLTRCDIPQSLMRRMRSSVIFLGAILARCGWAELSYPGGCELGPRPIDLHLSALRALGADISDAGGTLRCRAAHLRGCQIVLATPSVGATENAMLAACGAEGDTVICNAAREPEIADLQEFLCAMGAQVRGAGGSVITVSPGRALHGCAHRVIPDRIVTATYLCAAAAAGGEGAFLGTDGSSLLPVIEALQQAGCRVEREPDRVWIRQRGVVTGIGRVTTEPYPGFPTDAQPLLAAALAGGRGDTQIAETIFDRRFRYVEGLRTMGARIRVEGTTAWITGTKLRGAAVEASDLRGGAALTIAALGAEGESEIRALSHIDRGYECLENAFQTLGGQIRRMNR